MLRKGKFQSESKFFDSNRRDYLRQLKCEFETSKSISAKQETIANLANFAYNPENYDHIYNLSIHQLFVTNVDFADESISLTSLKGLCNLASYPPISVILCKFDVMHKILNSLKCNSDSPEFVINCLLLIITLKRLKLSLDEQTDLRLHKIINEFPTNIQNDNRARNLCQILSNKVF